MPHVKLVFCAAHMLSLYDTKRTLDFLFRKETRNLYWSRILSDQMEDSRGDYVFFEREKKPNSPKKFRRFPSSSSSSSPAASASHHFLAKSPSSANF